MNSVSALSHNEFVRRTLKILKSYKGEYDVTVLINCCVGLLIVPQQRFAAKVAKSPTVTKILSKISIWEWRKRQAPYDTLGHLRNSISHGHFTFVAKNRQISEIILQDFTISRPRRKSFETRLSIEEFRKLTIAIAHTILL